MQTELDFRYQYPDRFVPVYANGVTGGVNIQGEILLNFYFEQPSILNHEMINQNHSNPVESSGKISITRNISCGVILNINSLICMQEWIENQISLYQHLTKDDAT